MINRKLLFNTMLWSLGVAAVLGVVAVLTASFDVVGRITATAFLTSGVAALLWQATSRLERNEVSIWTAQLGGILFYAFALCAIWSDSETMDLWGTSLVILGCSSVAAGGWACRDQPGYRVTGTVTAALALTVAACWLWAIWIDFGAEDLMLTGFALAGWGLAAAICLVGVGTPPDRHWRWLGVGAALCGAALSEYAIVGDITEEWLSKALFVIGSITVVVIHAVLCHHPRHAAGRMTIRAVAIAATIVSAVLFDIIVVEDIVEDNLLLRSAIAAAIVASTSTIAVAFIIQNQWRLSRRDRVAGDAEPMSAVERTSAFSKLSVTCPQCGQESTLPTGRSACPGCGLRFTIEISEGASPRLDGWVPETRSEAMAKV